jgi:mannonate dehydratase
MPNGAAWNVVVNTDAPAGTIGRVSADQLWSRFRWFLKVLVPVAEEAGVRSALHPDDPLVEELRGTARLLWKPEHYHRVFALVPSAANMAEFCQGTVSKMNGKMDVYQAISSPAPERSRTCTCATSRAGTPTTTRCSSTTVTSIW